MNPQVAVLGLCLVAANVAASDFNPQSFILPEGTDQPPEERNWSASWDMAVHNSLYRAGVAVPASGIMHALDISLDQNFREAWRVKLSDRLQDSSSAAIGGRKGWNNSAREASLAYSLDPSLIIDAGRINTRYGVAYGYNPTDYFSAGSQTSSTSLDPTAVRSGRSGTLMARAQKFWGDGTLTGIYAAARDDTLSPPSRDRRWLVSSTWRISDGFAPEVVLFESGAEAKPAVGMNMTYLFGKTVGYIEWSGRRERSLLSRALNVGQAETFSTAFSAGISYTGVGRSLWVLEYEYDRAALDSAEWATLRRGAVLAYGRYRQFVALDQRLPTKQELFAYVTLPDMLAPRLDCSGWVRVNSSDHSSLMWLETRYRWQRAEVALQWLKGFGDETSVYGGVQERQRWQVAMKYFF